MNVALLALYWTGVAVLAAIAVGRAIRYADTQSTRPCHCGTCQR